MMDTLFGKTDVRTKACLFAYLFGRISLKGFLDHVGKEEGTRIKDIARRDGYILKNCKLFAWACFHARVKGKPFPRHQDYEVTLRDAVVLRRLNLNHLDVDLYRSFTLSEFDATVQRLLQSPELKAYIGKFVTKKMSFLINSYGDNREDICSLLRETAMLAAYKKYPRYESYLHFLNVAKTSIHNQGHTYITASTAKSKQRLLCNSDGSFESVHVPLDSALHLEAPAGHAAELKEKLQALMSLESRMSERTKSFLLCASGTYDAGFSKFLRCSNDLAAETMNYERYLTKLQNYFNVTTDDRQRLFSSLRANL